MILVVASPEGPCVAVGFVAAGPGDDGAAELSEQLGNGDGDQFQGGGAAVAGALPGGCDGQEGRGEQADGGRVGPGRPAGIAPGGFPRSARQTRRACYHAPGFPCVLAAGPSCWRQLVVPAGVPTERVSAFRGSGSG